VREAPMGWFVGFDDPNGIKFVVCGAERPNAS
jgi:hypothetical protein